MLLNALKKESEKNIEKSQFYGRSKIWYCTLGHGVFVTFNANLYKNNYKYIISMITYLEKIAQYLHYYNAEKIWDLTLFLAKL